MTVDGKLVHAITTNSHGITRLRAYADDLTSTIGAVRREHREWEERLKGMRIELTPGEERAVENNTAMLADLHKDIVEVKAMHEEHTHALRIKSLDERIGEQTSDHVKWADLDERIETRTANFITDDYLGDWMGDNGYIHESNFGEAFSEYVDSSDILEEVQNGLDIGSIACEVQDNLDMYELASEVQSNLDMYSLAQELQDNLDLEDTVAGVMASQGCRVLKENPGFADELCDMVLASSGRAIDDRIDEALRAAVLDGLRKVTSIPAFQEATNLHLRMDELAKSVESVKAMVKDLEHF